jgi:hypothetical protein
MWDDALQYRLRRLTHWREGQLELAKLRVVFEYHLGESYFAALI